MNVPVKTRSTSQSIVFPDGGYYFLKNNNFSVAVIGMGKQKIKKGHIHFDVGSITLSYKGISLIIDAGTYCYTRDINKRNEYRNINMHNLIVNMDDCPNFMSNNIFGIELPNKININSFNNNFISYSHNYFAYTCKRQIKINKSRISINDSYPTHMNILFHLNPNVNLYEKNTNRCIMEMQSERIILLSDGYIKYAKYHYSPGYNRRILSDKIVINGEKQINTDIVAS